MDDGSSIQILLTRSGVIAADDYESALEVAKFQDVAVGKILMATGRLSEPLFEAAVSILTFVRDGLVTTDQAVDALKLVKLQELSAEDALYEVGCEIGDDATKLGSLLCAAKIVTRKQLYEAIHLGHETGIPLGECLKATGILWEALLQHALSAQALFRSGAIDKEGAAKMIRKGYEGRVPVNYELSEFKIAGKQAADKVVTPESLAVECGFISQQESANCALSNVLGSELFDRLVVVTRMIAAGTLEKPAAIQVLKGTRALDEELSELVVDEKDNRIKIKFQDFLRIVNVIDKSALQRSGLEPDRKDKSGSADAIIVGKALLKAREVDSRTLFAALRCYYLMGTGWLSMEQGTCALAGFVADTTSQQSFDAYLQQQEWVR